MVSWSVSPGRGSQSIQLDPGFLVHSDSAEGLASFVHGSIGSSQPLGASAVEFVL